MKSKRYLAWLFLPCLLAWSGCSSSEVATERPPKGEGFVIGNPEVDEGAEASHDEARRRGEKDALLYNHGNSPSTP